MAQYHMIADALIRLLAAISNLMSLSTTKAQRTTTVNVVASRPSSRAFSIIPTPGRTIPPHACWHRPRLSHQQPTSARRRREGARGRRHHPSTPGRIPTTRAQHRARFQGRRRPLVRAFRTGLGLRRLSGRRSQRRPLRSRTLLRQPSARDMRSNSVSTPSVIWRRNVICPPPSVGLLFCLFSLIATCVTRIRLARFVKNARFGYIPELVLTRVLAPAFP